MRTPGHDFELAVGFCFTDGLLAGARCSAAGTAAPARRWTPSSTSCRVEPVARRRRPTPRLGTDHRRCGLCGSTTARRAGRPARPASRDRALPARGARSRSPTGRPCDQDLFAATGAVHAAAAFDRDGSPFLVREDIGRHNAVDKVVGRLLLDGRPPATGLGPVRQRPGLASRSCRRRGRPASPPWSPSAPPSALAVDTARAAGLPAGRVRPGRPAEPLRPRGHRVT